MHRENLDSKELIHYPMLQEESICLQTEGRSGTKGYASGYLSENVHDLVQNPGNDQRSGNGCQNNKWI